MKDIKPTRMELLNLKRKLKLAVNGHKLLKKKRDGLILELRNMLKDVRDVKKQLVEKLIKANKLVFEIELEESADEIDLVGEVLARENHVDVLVKNVMGVKMPKVEVKVERKIKGKAVLLPFSSKMIEAVNLYEEIFVDILKAAEIEISIRNLLEEIEKTKRRVNALENKVIPDLQESIAWVKMMLDEMERENVIRLKRIKGKR